MTAPDLVEVVAGVLEDHQFSTFDAEGHCVCTCDAVVMGEGEGWEEYPAHQARAVLDALTGVGTVQLGLMSKGDSTIEHCYTTEYAEYMSSQFGSVIVSRTVLPWTAAEQ